MITETGSTYPHRQIKPMIQRSSKFWTSFLRDEEAATTVEYALLITLILVFSISAILSTGDVQQALWFDTADDVQVIVNVP